MTRDEAGQVGGVEAVAFGTLIFIFGLLVIVNAWGAVDAKLAASAAAREGARTLVEADDPAAADHLVQGAVDETLTAHGRNPARADVPQVEGEIRRCGRITVSVTYRLPLIAIPLLGGSGRGLTVVGRHSEIVDPYRSGLQGEANCG